MDQQEQHSISTYNPAVSRPAKRVSRARWFIGGLVTGVLLVAAVVGGWFYTVGSTAPEHLNEVPLYSLLVPKPALNEEQTKSVEVATTSAKELATKMQDYANQIRSACNDPSLPEYRTTIQEVNTQIKDSIDTNMTRIVNARSSIHAAQETLGEGEEYDRLAFVDRALSLIADTMNYQRKLILGQDVLGVLPEGETVSAETPAYFKPAWDASQDFEAMEAPASLHDLHVRYASIWAPFATYLFNLYENGNGSVLELRSLREIIDWTETKEARALNSLYGGIAQQYAYASWMLSLPEDVPQYPEVGWSSAKQISPNLYASSGSVLDLAINTPQKSSVTIEAEVVGFTQKLEVMRTLEPGANHILLKPQMLADLTAADLEHGRTAQLDFKVIGEDGRVLEAQSASIELLGLYDFNWVDSQFNTTSQLDLIAWLRPAAPQIGDINRRAAEYMGEWTDGMFAEIAGYQYGDDWYATLLQTAAIQKALSDTGVKYVVDTYSPRADQRILTPQASIEMKQALCAETSLIVASCLLSAEMHPYIIITSNHAQVAVESWSGSGGYFLIETSVLPYEGVNRALSYEGPEFYGGLIPYCEDEGGTFTCLDDLGSSDMWNRYFASVEDDSDEYGGVYVIDCSLQRLFGLQGIESM